MEVLEALPQPCDGAAVPHGDGNVVRDLPAQLLHDLQGHGLLTLGEVGIDGGVAVIPAPAVDSGLAQLEGVLVAALDGDDGGAKGHQLGHLPLGGTAGDEDVGLETRGGGVPRQGGGGVAGGGAGNHLGSRLPCLGHGHGAGPVLEAGGGVHAVILHIELSDPQLTRQAIRLIERAPAHPQGGVGGTLLNRQQLPVAPHGVVPALGQRLPGKMRPDIVVVVDDVQDAAAGAVGEAGNRLVNLAAFHALGILDVFHLFLLTCYGWLVLSKRRKRSVSFPGLPGPAGLMHPSPGGRGRNFLAKTAFLPSAFRGLPSPEPRGSLLRGLRAQK